MRLIVGLFLCVLALPAVADEVRTVTVTGEGRISAEPDMAILRLGVSREARKASDAMRLASEAATVVLALVKASGVEARDVQTSNVSLSPRWQNERNTAPRIVGYVASNDLSVRVRDLENLGALMDAVVSDGANQMNGLSFAIAEPRPLQDEARKAAVADARAKAELLAASAGVSLGQVITISELGGGQPPVAMARSTMMEASAVPIATGEVDFHARVTIIFGIAE
ncbi:MAG: SIMPL domain-containing protein [Silicimonas sp.]|nr:SIMPL domain-containing protein [Silicimonas sp.]